ncbi:hypothetical protein M8C21_033332, partial [Ambrosia artemisiifolia]
CLGKKLSPGVLRGRNLQSASAVPQVIYQILEEPFGRDEIVGGPDIPQTLEEFVDSIKGSNRPDAKTFAIKLKNMITLLEQRTRTAKIQEYLYRHVASSSIPKNLHCLALRLAHEHATNAAARLQLPVPELVPTLVNNSYYHFVLASDNILAASVVATSLVYNSLRPEMVVVFLDDDLVVQSDLSPLWEIDMNGKVNGAVETCRGTDKFVMSKRFKNYLNFSHPLISKNFDPNECAWAYGMNIFDLEAWRKTNISENYHYWLEENLKSDLSLWHLGTLPPGLIAFHGHVHVIDPFWHMLGLGYQENTSAADVERAAVVHFNGRAKPWLDIAFPELKKLWT